MLFIQNHSYIVFHHIQWYWNLLLKKYRYRHSLTIFLSRNKWNYYDIFHKYFIEFHFGRNKIKSDGLTYRVAKFLICFFAKRSRYLDAKNMLAATEIKCDICVIYLFPKHRISIVFAYAAFSISKRFNRDWFRRWRCGILSKLFHRGFSLDRISFHSVPVPFYETSIMTDKLCDFTFIPAE